MCSSPPITYTSKWSSCVVWWIPTGKIHYYFYLIFVRKNYLFSRLLVLLRNKNIFPTSCVCLPRDDGQEHTRTRTHTTQKTNTIRNPAINTNRFSSFGVLSHNAPPHPLQHTVLTTTSCVGVGDNPRVLACGSSSPSCSFLAPQIQTNALSARHK